MTVGNACPSNSYTPVAGSLSIQDCVCHTGYVSDGSGNCISQVATSSIAIIDSSQTYGHEAVSSQSTVASTISSSELSVDQSSSSNSNSETSSTSSNNETGFGAAFSNPFVIIALVGASLVVFTVIGTVGQAYRRVKNAKLQCKIGITSNMNSGTSAAARKTGITTLPEPLSS